MTKEMRRTKCLAMIMEIGYDEALKRLCPDGSGAESCFSDAKRREQDGVEERSRDGGRVSPGEAEAMERYCKEVAACNMAYAVQHAADDKKQLAAYYAGIAAGWETAAVVLPYFHERAGAGQRCDEGASGRRNDQGDGRRVNGPTSPES